MMLTYAEDKWYIDRRGDPTEAKEWCDEVLGMYWGRVDSFVWGERREVFRFWFHRMDHANWFLMRWSGDEKTI
jgi:hypothetical protein